MRVSSRSAYRRLSIALISLAVGASLAVAALTSTGQRPPPLLDPPELARLAALQQTARLELFGGVSPDGQAIVIGVSPQGRVDGGPPVEPYMAVLDTRDGSMQPIDRAVLRLPPQTDFSWSDERTAVYVGGSSPNEPRLVRIDRASGAIQSAQLALPGRPLSLAPTGMRLLAEVVEGQSSTLLVVDLITGTSAPLLSYPPSAPPTSIAWSPDGTKVALVRVATPAELAADPARLNELAFQDLLGQLPPNENPLIQGNVVDLFDLDRGVARPAALTAADGDGWLFHRLAWSPDGETLLAKMLRPARLAGRPYPSGLPFYGDSSALRLYDAELRLLETLERPEIAAGAQTVHATFASPNELLITSPDGPTAAVYRYDRRTGAFTRLPTGEGSVAEEFAGPELAVAHGTRHVIYIHSSFARPPEIYRLGLDDASPQALTMLNAVAASASQLRTDRVSFSLASGATRDGYLIQPAGAPFPPQDVPIVVYQQGGPGGAMTNRWAATTDDPASLLPNFGIAVLFMPFSGREGYGPAFLNALADGDNFGALDVDEAAEVVRAMIEHGYTSPGRVGITGGSYGGYFASQSIVRHPGLYGAANPQCPLLDLSQWWQSQGRATASYMEGRTPDADPAEYEADSPISGAGRARTPLLLFHGTEDFLPLATVEQFRDGVAASGTPAELITFRGEGHCLTEPGNLFDAAQAQIDWFRRYLQAPAAPIR